MSSLIACISDVRPTVAEHRDSAAVPEAAALSTQCLQRGAIGNNYIWGRHENKLRDALLTPK